MHVWSPAVGFFFLMLIVHKCLCVSTLCYQQTWSFYDGLRKDEYTLSLLLCLHYGTHTFTSPSVLNAYSHLQDKHYSPRRILKSAWDRLLVAALCDTHCVSDRKHEEAAVTQLLSPADELCLVTEAPECDGDSTSSSGRLKGQKTASGKQSRFK